MSDPGKAVFLSYASQDAEAALRLCSGLRAAGVEVWFDQNELVGGDAWDAKIRKQIAECALFVPIISANTQARLEGYFRIEWKLAARRTHGIATAKAFLLPIVIDDTRDAGAHVPDEFREVQWTKLPGGDTPPKFCERVKKLLGGESASGAGSVVDQTPGHRPGAKQAHAPLRPWLVPVALGAAAVIALVFWRPWNNSSGAPGPSMTPAPAPSVSRSGAETAADLAKQARHHYYPFATPANLQLADEISRRATELDPQNARGWGTRANASARYLLRSFVSGEAAQQRARDAQSFANRALTLDKNETEALVALGIVAMHQHASTQAETLFRRVLTVDPNNVQAPSLLSMVLRDTGRSAEALPLMKRAVANAPRDPILHLFLGFAYWSGWNFTKAAEQFDTAATVADFQAPRVYQAWVVFRQTGDLARLRTMLESVDLIYSAEDSKLTYLLACGLFERRADRVIEAAGRTASAYFDAVAMPKAWFSALAYESDHKDNLARQQWLAAEAVIRERLRADPQSEMLRINLAITLAKLGRTPEARTEFDAIEVVWREQLTPSHALWLARFHAAMGDAPRAVALLRQSVNRLGDDAESFQNTTSRTIQFDPWWDPIRAATEFRELLAHPPEPPAPIDDEPAKKISSADTKTDGKSIAVLAFDNRSDDKDAEYFSDGISDELINTLGRVAGLTVKGRTSAFFFKGKNATAQEIGEKLGVAYLVRGSVRTMGNKVRITAQLSRAATDEVVWSSEPLERELKDVFAVQDEIAGLIAKNLSVKLGANSTVARPVNPEAYSLFLQGRMQAERASAAGLKAAIEICLRVVALEPDFTAAWVQIARANILLARWSSIPTGEGFAAAREAAAKAAALAPDDPEVLVALGWVRRTAEWDWRGAEQAFRRALTLRPNHADTVASAAVLIFNLGKVDEAIRLAQHAVELDPLNPTSHASLGQILGLLARYVEGEQAYRRALQLAPNGQSYHALLSENLALQERLDDAERELALEPSEVRRLQAQALIDIGRGRTAGALAQARTLESAGRAQPGTADTFSHAALIYAILGDKDRAFAALEEARAMRDPLLPWAKVTVAWKPLHSDPRWPEFLRQLGLADDQLK